MRAIRLRLPADIGSLELVDVPEPPATGPGELRVRVRASTLNYHDYAVVKGFIPVADGRVPLSDACGEVLAIGEGIAGYAVGDRVISTFIPDWVAGRSLDHRSELVPGDAIDGFAQEIVTRPAAHFTRAPRGLGDLEAASVTCAGVTAWRALVPVGGLKAGDTVLVQGSGGVSVFALQFAKAMGATVIATSSSDDKLERLRALGADHLINYRTTPRWSDAVRDATNGLGVEHVVEVGGAGTLPESIKAVRNGGTIALVGVLAGIQGPIPTAMLFAKQIRLIGLTVGSREHHLDTVRAIEATGITPVVDQSFPLDALQDAFQLQQAGGHFGKIGITL